MSISWREKMTEKLNFQKDGYCVIKSALSKELINFVTQYALFDEMQNFTPDTSQVVGAHAKYADPAMESVLLLLQDTIQNATSLELFPTYSFYRVYRPGDDLKPHKDRESCQISATLCFNYNYEKYKWPIYMGENKVIQEPGDLVIYKGVDIEHYRNVFDLNQEDAWHVQGFFHYVDQHGPYKDFKFDNRESIGVSNLEKDAYKQDSLNSWLYYK
jgi:hypothetical protein